MDVPQLVVGSSRRAMALAADALYGHPERRPRRRRRHGHERQDDHRLPRPRGARGGARVGRPARHGRVACRRRRRAGRAHDARERRPAGDAAADGRRGRPRLRDGGLVARARARPGHRRALRRRRVHEPDAGPPRLPSRHGGTTSPPRRACSPRRPARSTSATRTAAAWRRSAGGPVLTYARASDADADVRPHAVEIGAGGAIALIVSTPRGPLPLDVRLRGGFNVENVLCAVALAELLELPHAAVRAGIAVGAGRPGPVRGGRGRPAVHRARRLRAHARTGSRTCSRPPARSPRGG